MSTIVPHILNLVRDSDRPRYISALLANPAVRDRLLTLYAFDLEISAIPDRVVEPLAGEIRLQWWRDVFDRAEQGGGSRNPVADGVLSLIRETQLSKAGLITLIDTQSHLFHDNPVPDCVALERVFVASHGSILAMGCGLLSSDVTVDQNLIRSAACAIGYTRMVVDFAKQASNQRLMIPSSLLEKHGVDLLRVYRGEISDSICSMLDDVRDKARDCLSEVSVLIRQIDPVFMPALAHLAGFDPILRSFEKIRTDPFAVPRVINPILLQWRIWRFAQSRKL